MASGKKIDELPLESLSLIQSYLGADDIRSLKQTNKKLSSIPLMECSDFEENSQECLWGLHLGCIKKLVIRDPGKFFYVLEYMVRVSDEVYDFVEWYNNFNPLNKHHLARIAILASEILDDRLLEWVISQNLYDKLTDNQFDRLISFLIVKAFYFNGVEYSIDFLTKLDMFQNYIGEIASDMLSREEAEIIMEHNLANYSDLGASHNREENELDNPYWVDLYERFWKESMILD